MDLETSGARDLRQTDAGESERSDGRLPAQQRRRFMAAHIGLAMIFYALFSIFLTLPVVLLFAMWGLPVRVDLETMQIYGTQWALQLVNLIVIVFRLGVPFLFLMVACRQEIGLSALLHRTRWSTLGAAVPLLFGLSVVGSFTAELLQRLMTAVGLPSAVPSFSIPVDPWGIAASFILYVILPAVLEEFLFRGAILQGLRCFGDGAALAISSLFFGLAHFNVPQGANALLMGLAIGYFVLRTRSIWTGVLLHLIVNAFVFLESILFRTVLADYAEFAGNVCSFVFLIGGFLCFLFWSRKEKGLFLMPILENGAPRSRARVGAFFGNVAVILSLLLLIIGFGV